MGGRSLLFLFVLAATAMSVRATDCPSSIYDHTVNLEGAIEFPVLHRNHPCLGLMSTPNSNQMEAQLIDVIEDSSINTFLFLMPIKLGTPAVMNLVAIDTGSTLSWVQCQPCTVLCHGQAPDAGPIFDPRKSNTFQHVPCASRECLSIKYALKLQFANCMEKEDSCLYSMAYGNGWVYSVGKVVRDNINIEIEDKTIIFDLFFGCSEDVEYPHEEAGIIGFGTSSFSFFEQASSFINYKSFSYCLPTDETVRGYMILGNYKREGVDGYTPLFPSASRPTYSLSMDSLVANGQSLVTSSSEMILDSGSFWTVLSPYTFGRLDDVITMAMATVNYSRIYSKGNSYICFQSEADSLNYKGKHTVFSNWSTLPTMEMSFAGGAITLSLPAKNLFHNNPKYGLCMNFMKGGHLIPQVLGNQVTRSVEIIFDIEGKVFGFRYAAC